MQLGIVGLGLPLLYSETFIGKVDHVISLNVEDNVDGTAIFISRLIKGLQELSNTV